MKYPGEVVPWDIFEFDRARENLKILTKNRGTARERERALSSQFSCSVELEEHWDCIGYLLMHKTKIIALNISGLVRFSWNSMFISLKKKNGPKYKADETTL